MFWCPLIDHKWPLFIEKQISLGGKFWIWMHPIIQCIMACSFTWMHSTHSLLSSMATILIFWAIIYQITSWSLVFRTILTCCRGFLANWTFHSMFQNKTQVHALKGIFSLCKEIELWQIWYYLEDLMGYNKMCVDLVQR